MFHTDEIITEFPFKVVFKRLHRELGGYLAFENRVIVNPGNKFKIIQHK